MYLRDIAKHGENYLTNITHPHQIFIQQSRPFRMKKPRHQADFFKLLSKLFYYLIQGSSHVGYLTAENWNKYYRAAVQQKHLIQNSRLEVCEKSRFFFHLIVPVLIIKN